MVGTLLCLLASGEEVAIVMFASAGAVGIALAIGHSICKSREAAYNARLKQLMIERGMSAAEIDQIVRSQPDDPNKQRKGCGGWFGQRSVL